MKTALEKPAKPKYRALDVRGVLSMRLPDSLPRFAILPAWCYMQDDLAVVELSRRENRSRHRSEAFHSIEQANWLARENREWARIFVARPSSAVPADVAAKIPEWEREGFSDLRVLWEATWQEVIPTEARTLNSPEDPILVGSRENRDWILATWDLTKAESYVCAEFTE